MTSRIDYRIGDEVVITGCSYLGDSKYHSIPIGEITTIQGTYDAMLYDGSYELSRKDQSVRPCDFRLIQENQNWRDGVVSFIETFNPPPPTKPKDITFKRLRKNKMTKLTTHIKKMLGLKKATIMEAFTDDQGSLDICSPEFAEWFIEKFFDDKDLLEKAKARLARDKDERK